MKIFSILLLFFGLVRVSYSQDLSIIPKPVSIKHLSGKSFKIDSCIRVFCFDESLKNEALYFEEALKAAIPQKVVLITAEKFSKNYTPFILPDDAIKITLVNTLPQNTYEILIQEKCIYLNGGSATAVFHGIQSLLQLFYHSHKNDFKISAAKITDNPRFEWRGMHLDVCRHFFPASFVKKYIDILAMHKMNVFHWHLTDDQGWRIEIKKYPLLTSIGGWRKRSMTGRYSEHKFDTIPHGGYYSQEEIKDIVAYAQERHITIVPEIEMPGHALAALSAYPNYSCKGGSFEVAQEWGVFDDVFCAGNDETFTFLQNVLDEVCTLFPGKYIHIGGDECPKTRWKTCSKCQLRMQQFKLKDEHELQSYFIQRIEKYVNNKGKRIIGWDEILEGGLAPNAAVMSWRGTEGGIAAAKQKHAVVMTPGSHCYFDHYQGNPKNEPIAFGGFTPLEKVYAYEPVPDVLNNTESSYIMGAQANIWTEYITSQEHVEYMALPRMCALSEVLWSEKNTKSYANFLKRLTKHLQILDAKNLNYARSMYDVEFTTLVTDSGLMLKPTYQKLLGKLHYSIVNKTQTNNQFSYNVYADKPIPLHESCVIDGFLADSVSGKMLGKNTNRELFISCATAKKLQFNTSPNPSYNNGDQTLVDGIKGSLPRINKEWLGWNTNNVEITLDLSSVKAIQTVNLTYLKDEGSWIYLPSQIEIWTSKKGKKFKKRTVLSSTQINAQEYESVLTFKKTKAKWVKIKITNFGTIPDGKPGGGNLAWIFLSEIGIN